MVSQPDLDGPVYTRRDDPETSYLAADVAARGARNMRDRILAWFRARPEVEVARFEIPGLIGEGERQSSARSRVADLVAMGELMNTGRFIEHEGTQHETVKLTPDEYVDEDGVIHYPRISWKQLQADKDPEATRVGRLAAAKVRMELEPIIEEQREEIGRLKALVANLQTAGKRKRPSVRTDDRQASLFGG